jgi:hypothetical protein
VTECRDGLGPPDWVQWFELGKEEEIERIKSLGVEIRTEKRLGNNKHQKSSEAFIMNEDFEKIRK